MTLTVNDHGTQHSCIQVGPWVPIRARISSRAELRLELTNRTTGGIYFTTTPGSRWNYLRSPATPGNQVRDDETRT